MTKVFHTISVAYLKHSSRAYSSSLLHVIIACNHLPFLKTFSNFVRVCPNFQIFCTFLLFLNILFALFCPFSEKIAHMPLLSRIRPEQLGAPART